ncbi:unnamed protein product, partial [Auanema sp. JU1783]
MKLSWLILPILSILVLVDGCDWLMKIKEKKVDFKVLGAGQHRVLAVKTRIVSEQRFLECRLLYEFEIPDGAYIDGDSINSTLINHKAYIKDPFDVEVMQGHAKRQKVLVLHSNIIRRSFAVEDNLELPVRIRYHPAKEAALGTPQKAKVVFVTPTVALDCPNDYESLGLAKCVGKRSYNSFSVQSQAPYWVLIEPL